LGFGFSNFSFCSEISIEMIDKFENLEAEKKLYIKAYSFYFKELVDIFQIKDLEKVLSQRFDADVSAEHPKNAFGIRALDKDKVVAFLMVVNLEMEKTLVLLRVAIDPEKNIKEIAEKLLQFVSKKFPTVQNVITTVRRESVTEKILLTSLGFQEYNPSQYTYFKFEINR
jgi:hypothetical protein